MSMKSCPVCGGLCNPGDPCKDVKALQVAMKADDLPHLSNQLIVLLDDFIAHIAKHRGTGCKGLALYPDSFRIFVRLAYEAAGRKAWGAPLKLACQSCLEVWIADDEFGFNVECPKCREYPPEVLSTLREIMDRRYRQGR